jgi:hypothetical protein
VLFWIYRLLEGGNMVSFNFGLSVYLTVTFKQKEAIKTT